MNPVEFKPENTDAIHITTECKTHVVENQMII